MRRLIILIASLAVVAALPAVAPAKSDPGVIKTGRCSNGASWKLKAKHDDGLIEVVFRGARITRPPSGSFEVNRRIRNPAGSDRIVASARAARGGTCRAALTI